jgi:hypothetical protein
MKQDQDSENFSSAEKGNTPRSSSARRADSDAAKRSQGLVRVSLWLEQIGADELAWLADGRHEVTDKGALVTLAIWEMAQRTRAGMQLVVRKTP